MQRQLDVASSIVSSLMRAGAGISAGRLGPRPKEPIELYEFERCPYCRKVREAVTVLDLDVIVRPSPPGGTRFRPEAERLGGKRQFPFLVDPNTDQKMYESDEIIRHLFDRYGAMPIPLSLRLGPLTMLSSVLASVPRLPRRPSPGRVPDKLLELWSYEASPFSRLVRETLDQMEMPYLLHSVGHGSPKRTAFVERSKKMQVPYLADPNTGREMFESADIIAYLRDTYGSATPPSDAST